MKHYDRDSVTTVTILQRQTGYGDAAMLQHKQRVIDDEESYEKCCLLLLCYPFTAVVSGPTGCGRTAWVLRMIANVRNTIEYYYDEYQYC